MSSTRFGYYGISVLILTTLSVCAHAERMVIDGIVIKVPHSDGDLLALRSDMGKSFDGTIRTPREVALDLKMVAKARTKGMQMPAAAADSIIANIQKRYKISLDQIKALFEAQGLTLEEGRELLVRRSMIDELLHIMIRVDEPSIAELEAYYKEHPEYEEATYTIRPGFYASTQSIQEAREQLRTHAHDLISLIQWYPQETYLESELSPEQQFVTTQQEGALCLLDNVPGGFDVIQVVSITHRIQKPFNETEISAQLRQERFIKAYNTFQEELLNEGDIRYCSETVRLEVLTLPSDTSSTTHDHATAHQTESAHRPGR